MEGWSHTRGEELERMLVLFDDDKQRFETVLQLDLNAQLRLDGRPFRVRSGGRCYQYFLQNPSRQRVFRRTLLT